MCQVLAACWFLVSVRLNALYMLFCWVLCEGLVHSQQPACYWQELGLRCYLAAIGVAAVPLYMICVIVVSVTVLERLGCCCLLGSVVRLLACCS